MTKILGIVFYLESTFQLEILFKVVDEMDESVLNGVTIKMKNVKDSEDIKTDGEGNGKPIHKYQSGTTFDVEISMDGYKLIKQQIRVDERQSKNTFSFKMERKSVIHNHRDMFPKITFCFTVAIDI